MRYYVYESNLSGDEWQTKDKCRRDIRKLLTQRGYEPIGIPVSESGDEKEKDSVIDIAKKGLNTGKNFKSWMDYLKKVRRNDIVVIQYPPYQRTLLANILVFLKMKGAFVIGLIQDLGSYRNNDEGKMIKRWSTVEDAYALSFFNQVIVNNVKMRKILLASEFNDKKLVNIRLFDYLTDGEPDKTPEERFFKDAPIVIAAESHHKFNEKGYYLYSAQCDPGVKFNVYGPDIDERYINNLTYEYKGAVLPEQIPNEIEGSFGLVWEGNSLETCEGDWGEYLRINNPNKASMYIAAGIPLIIWSGAALADFVQKYGLGITVDSIYELKSAVENVTDVQYAQMLENIRPFTKAVKSGAFFTKAIERAELRL